MARRPRTRVMKPRGSPPVMNQGPFLSPERPAMDLLEQEIEKALLGINSRPGLSTDPNRRARLPVTQPPAPPPMMPPRGPMMPDPVQAAVNKLPGEPGFPGQGPKFPGVPPVQIPEPVGPIGMPPTPPPVGGGEPTIDTEAGGGRGTKPPRPPTGTPVDLATHAPFGSVGIHPTLGEIFAGPGVSGGKRYYTADGYPVPKDSPGFSRDPRHGYLNPIGDWYQPPAPPPPIDTEGGRPPYDPDPPVGTGPVWPGFVPDDPWGPMCPSPKEHIQLANNDWILAGELKVGDEVITSKEPQKVTRVQRIEGAPRCEVLFEDSDSIVSSYSHPYFVNSKGFVEVGNLEKGDIIGDLVVKDKKPFSDGPVISLSVDKAETYMLRGGTEENPVPALSHNKSPMLPTPEEIEKIMLEQQEREQRWLANPPQPGDPEFEAYTRWWETTQSGTSCPSPEEHIQLANNDWILAGEIKVGDEVITSKAPQKVTFAKTIENSPRREVLFKEGDSIVTSPSHPYFVKDKGFVDVEDLKEGDAIGDLIVKEVQPFSDGPVIHISVDKAHTYMLRGGTEENPVPALSHNKLYPVPEPPEPPWPPTPTTPTTPTTPVTTTPVTPTTPVTTTPVTPETTAVQGTTMEEMQKMIADMQAQMQEQAAARAAQEAQMSKNYMISDERIGYNPYLSGQYQPDPYGPGGVPDMGGITTIPVPQPLTGIGYANYNPRRKI